MLFPCESQAYTTRGAIGKDRFPGKYGRMHVELALYDLSIDAGEDRDVKDLYPEVVKQLSTIADKYRNELGDGLTKHIGSEVRPAGKMGN